MSENRPSGDQTVLSLTLSTKMSIALNDISVQIKIVFAYQYFDDINFNKPVWQRSSMNKPQPIRFAWPTSQTEASILLGMCGIISE